MKAKVIDIEGVGKAIFGKADGASIEEILNSIKEDIAEAANESKDKEYHDHVIKLIEGDIKGAKEANQSVAEFVEDQREKALKEEIDCFCPYCIMKTIESVTEEDIAKYGKANVEYICDGFAEVLKRQMVIVSQKIDNKLRWILEHKHGVKSYEDMTKEELIAELKKQK
jgi:hypothetical protein